MSFSLTKLSPITGKENTMELPIDEETFKTAEAFRQRGMLIQHAYPMLSADHREFILTGVTPEEWAAAFPDEEEEDPDHGDGRGDFEAF